MEQKAGRNDPCPCGSGKKYKQCCYGKEAKKTYTATGKRKFSAKVLNVSEQGQSIFQSIGAGAAKPISAQPFDGLKFRMTKKDYRSDEQAVVFPFKFPTSENYLFVKPTESEKREPPEVYEMTQEDYRVG